MNAIISTTSCGGLDATTKLAVAAALKTTTAEFDAVLASAKIVFDGCVTLKKAKNDPASQKCVKSIGDLDKCELPDMGTMTADEYTAYLLSKDLVAAACGSTCLPKLSAFLGQDSCGKTMSSDEIKLLELGFEVPSGSVAKCVLFRP